MKQKIQEALDKEKKLDAEDYKVESNKPIYGHRTATARNIIKKMKSGDSVLVLTRAMATTIVRVLAEEGKNMGTFKKEGEGYRVWLI